MSSMWMFDLAELDDLGKVEDEKEYSCRWNHIKLKGKDQPGKISHHSSVVYKNKVYVYGGNSCDTDPQGKIYELDLSYSQWSLVKLKDEVLPDTRDEHTAVLAGSKMYIFGGFKRGMRTNSVLVYNFETSKFAAV